MRGNRDLNLRVNVSVTGSPRTIDRFKRSQAGFNRAVRDGRREAGGFNRTIGDARRGTAGLNREADRLVREMRDLTAATARSTAALERLGRSKRNNNNTFREGVGIFTTGALAAATLGRAWQAAERALRALTVGAVEAGVSLEGFRQRLGVGVDTAGLAAEELGFLRAESQRLGISFEAAAHSYSGFIASTRGTRIEGRASREIFSGIAEAARVMNLSAADTQGVFTALEQIISKGTVSAEELRGQLGERLPGAFLVAAEAMGVTTEELDDMLRKGELLAEDLLPKLAAAFRERVAGELPQAVDSAAASFDRMSNAVFELQAAIAESGLLDAAAGAAEGLAASIRYLTATDLRIEIDSLDVETLRDRLAGAQDSFRTLARVPDSGHLLRRLGREIGLIEERLGRFSAGQLRSTPTLGGDLLAQIQAARGPRPYSDARDDPPFADGVAADAADEFHRLAESLREAARPETESVRALYEARVRVIRDNTLEGSRVQNELLGLAAGERQAALDGIAAREEAAERDRVRRMLESSAREFTERARIRREEQRRAETERAVARQRRLQAERDARAQELIEAQGFNSQAELEVERHEQAKLAIRNRYGSDAQRQLLLRQREAANLLQKGEKGNRGAIAQIVTGSLQSSLGELGRYNRRAFRLSQAAGIANAIISTQKGIAESLGQPGPAPLRILYAGLIAAQGAAAVAAIRSQRPPQAFARGGIVDSPTFFSARGVPRGVAGEAGPEAILPLRRGPGGRLGVEASGRSTVVHFSPRVDIRVEAGAGPDAAEAAARRAAGALRREFGAFVDDEMRPGGRFHRLNVA